MVHLSLLLIAKNRISKVNGRIRVNYRTHFKDLIGLVFAGKLCSAQREGASYCSLFIKAST